MEEVCQKQIIPSARKPLSPSPYSGPNPVKEHSKVVLEPENVISVNLEKTL